MAVSERIDSPNPAVRAIERRKRGLAASAIIGISTLAALLIAALATWIVELIGVSEFAQAATGVVAFGIAAPWLVGNRPVLREIGKLADVPDS